MSWKYKNIWAVDNLSEKFVLFIKLRLVPAAIVLFIKLRLAPAAI